jgi:D-alanine-D-alanine ligase
MRVVVLHSDVAADAAPDEIETIVTARAIADVLRKLGHNATLMPFAPPLDRIGAAVREAGAEIVFNMVESVLGLGELASTAPAMLEKRAVRYTGNGAGAIALTCDKPLAKNVLRSSGLPTPDWAEPPLWDGLAENVPYIVKSATEDASLGLDDDSVLRGRQAISARAQDCAKTYGGRWFAETYVEGREFNVAVLEDRGVIEILPIPEMRFDGWPDRKARIVGYRAKWDERSEESVKTVRAFGIERESPNLAASLGELTRSACRLFGIRGYARVDFRVDEAGQPTILEINPNPSLDPAAGFASAAAAAGYSYEDVIGKILAAASPI